MSDRPMAPATRLAKRARIAFQYPQIQNKSSFRLLKFNRKSDEELSCSLQVYGLNNAPPYDALSYTWGPSLSRFSESNSQNDEDATRRIPVSCDGKTIMITESLRSALRMLQSIDFRPVKSRKSQHFWIDALCIDQDDALDRNVQVSIMDKIYRGSQKVVVWLGEEDHANADAMKVMNVLSSVPVSKYGIAKKATTVTEKSVYDSLHIEQLTATNYLGFITLLSRPWFKRAWIVQEAALAQKVIGVCGSMSFRWESLSKTLSFLKASGWESQLTVQKLMERYLPEEALDRYEALLNSNATIETAALYLERTRDEFENRRNRQKRGPIYSRKPSLRLLLETHRYSETSDPRDKIFAFLGLASHRLKPWTTHQNPIVPNYNMSAKDLFIHVARVLMESYQSLSLLSHVQSATSTKVDDLPSWVPDWSVELRPYPLRFRGSCNWCANASWSWTPKLHENGPLLTVQGIRVDVVEAIVHKSMHEEDFWDEAIGLSLGLDEPYGFRSARGKCLQGLKFLVTGIQPKLGRNDMEHLIREHGGLLTSTPSNTIDYAIVGKQPGSSKVQHIKTLDLRVIDEDELLKLISDRQAAEVERTASASSASSPFPSRSEVLWRTLMTDTFEKQHPAPPICEAVFTGLMSEHIINKDAWKTLAPSQLLQNSLSATLQSSNNHMKMQAELEAAAPHRRLFRTKTKMLGLGPVSLLPGDEVWILASGQVPYILRRKRKGGHFQLIGEAYVHGIMHGEGVALNNGRMGEAVLD